MYMALAAELRTWQAGHHHKIPGIEPMAQTGTTEGPAAGITIYMHGKPVCPAEGLLHKVIRGKISGPVDRP